MPDSLLVETALVLLALVTGLAIPDRVNSAFRGVGQFANAFASNSLRCLLLSFLVPIFVRIATLAIYPIPQPVIADEFSHLLVADTLLQGRLANPTHVLWRHFETLYVMFQPTYASLYPVGQGAALAFPQFLGLPAYWGVWLSVGVMSAAIFWMLEGWVKPVWALAATILILPRITVFGYWIHSYWGGAVAATGGALALGAFARLIQKPASKPAWIMGAGMFIVANSRPYEGAALIVVLAIALILKFHPDTRYRVILVPLAVSGVATVCLITLHNYRVTGEPLKLPYQLHREIYGTPQNFFWQKAVERPVSDHPAIAANQRWQREMYDAGTTLNGFGKTVRHRLFELWLFFFGPLWTPALLLLPWIPKPYRVPLVAAFVVLCANLFYPFSFSHYYGPVAGVFVLVVVGGLHRMRSIVLFGKACGAAACTLLLVAAPLIFLYMIGWDLYARQFIRQPNPPRTQVIDALKRVGGSHIVFVRYSPEHDFHKEIVYNTANIDEATVVWARDMGVEPNREVLRYYQGRRFWIFEPDVRPPRLSEYRGAGTGR